MSSHNTTVDTDEINLGDYWRTLVRRRRLLGSIVCGIVLLTVIVMLLLPDIYQGKAVLIPLGASASNAQTVLGELGSLLPGGLGGSENPATRLLAILQSRTLVEEVVQRLDLLPLLFADDWNVQAQQWMTDDPPTLQDAVKTLLEDVVVSAWDESKGIITITAVQKDPVLAAAIVNQFIEVMQRILNDSAFTLAKKNRLFLETQTQQTKQDLVVAEEALRQYEQQYGIVALDAQAQATVTTLAGIEAQIMSKEVQLGVLQRSLTGASREVSFLLEEIQGLRTQLTRLQQGFASPVSPSSGASQNRSLFPALDKAPDIKLDYSRLQRDSLLQNKLYGLLIQQYEQAKIDEARDETAFQILDRAIPPDEKIKPKRGLIVLLSMFASVALGVPVALVREALDTTIRTKEQAEQGLGVSVLATIPPPLQHKRGQRSEPLTLVSSSSSPAHTPREEAFRYLYMRLKHASNGSNARTILFTSPEATEETAITIVNVACIAARAGEKALLVDSNLQQPALHTLLHCAVNPGLDEVLAHPERWQEGVHPTSVDNLYLLPGDTSLSTSLSFDAPAFTVLLEALKEAYDWLFFCGSPVLPYTDAVVLSTKVDATCLVLTRGVSRFEASTEAKAALDAVQGKVIGAVLTHWQT